MSSADGKCRATIWAASDAAMSREGQRFEHVIVPVAMRDPFDLR